MKLARLLLAAVLAVAALAVADTGNAEDATNSALTVSGTGSFSSLKVTVDQTTDLINQTVHVSWTGGAPTGPSGNFATNYLQLMQCWGDDPAGPTREQCQYGGLAAQGSPVAGAWARRRQVSYGSTLVDPLETLKPAAPGQQAVVPFRSVTGVTTTSPGDFFTAGTTNELPLAKTRLDGGGEVDFEVQTALESYGLGCGTVVNGSPRSCWLVVVPRGNKEVDGSTVGGDNRPQLDSSPLSASNWAQHLSIPLKFQPVGAACPIGAAERPTSGDEFLADAVLRWQPKLCAGGGTVFGFTQVPDGVARQTLLSDNPGLSFLRDPVPPDQATKPLVYAPIALSGLSIAFITERQSAGEGVVPPEIWHRDGEQITDLSLTPRLVAKLLTQSYVLSLPVRQDYLKGNPDSLTADPEFVALNPEFKDSGRLMSIVDALVPTVDMDATTALWRWIAADKDATDFLNGVPDPHGMKVNPNFKGLKLPVSNFPKADLTCTGTGLLASCALDLRPLAGDMHEAGRAISRGDTLGKAPTGFATPDGKPQLKAVDRQPQGQRSLLAVVDTPTAARYGLPTAKLRNASGAFVAPSDASMLSAVAAAKPGAVGDVLSVDPLTTAKDAYPLTNLAYAATAPSALDTKAGADYAAFLKYAVGDGQQPGIAPGQLPAGYVPLPAALRAQTTSAADKIAADAGKAVTPPTSSAPAPDSVRGPPVGGSPAGDQSLPGGQQPPATSAPASAPLPVKAVTTPPTTSAVQQPVAQARPTPATPVGFVRYVLLILLAAGAVAAASGPALTRWGSRRGR
ncbi:hypothetical protein OG738_30120 [Amycolatopsis sp. NBC_01488]|uniref:hypothetical protein n=1 Tax=Amycolatopsis sp. NBC_01488 TaxID=2903563 RepID=UPI002E288F8E|nr:hypothetical protein [Amycolatopsis sp. NBC_01488]